MQVDATTVTGGATVPATGLGTIPALYAQAYATSTGQQSIAITNKGAMANQMTIRVNGTPVVGPLSATFIAGSDLTTQNTATSQNAVSVQTSTLFNPITVPAYSVMRVDLNVPFIASAVNSASYFSSVVAPQEIVSLFGSEIPLQTAGASLPLPTALGSTSVQITDSASNSQLAPLFSVSYSQANILIPSGLAPGQATLTTLHVRRRRWRNRCR